MNFSDSYRKELINLHSNPVFGDLKNIPSEVSDIISHYKISSILDFGCGKGRLVSQLENTYPSIKIFGYDPAQENFMTLPSAVDMIVSFDVLEHIEPEFLEPTLDSLHKICNKILHVVIACHPSKRFLSNGKNAHLIIEPPDWWKLKFVRKDWTIRQEKIITYKATPKKGGAIDVIKYCLTSEKNG